MAFEFQVVDVRFSDWHMDSSRHAPREGEIVSCDFLQTECERVRGEREFVAYVFGRDEDGRSICVHTVGWRPKLYYACALHVRPIDVQRELVKLMRLSRVTAVRDTDFHVEPVVRHMASGAVLDDSGRRVPARYFCVSFPDSFSYKQACYVHQKEEIAPSSPIATPHHTKPSLETKFMIDTGIVPSGWVRVSPSCYPPPSVSHCDVEVSVGVPDFAFVERDQNAPLHMLAFDIECVSAAGNFPNAANAGDVVCQVSVCTWVLTNDTQDRSVLITQGSCAPIDGVQVVSCEDEKALLLELRAQILRWDADVVLQFNGYGFDIPYLHQRGLALPAYAYMGKLRFKPCRLRQKPLTSQGMGANVISYVDMDGRSNFDVFMWYKSNFKEPSYSLNDMASRILNEQKEDFSYKLITPYFYGTDEERAVLGRYCVQDSVLLRKLARKLTFIEGDLAQSQVSMVLLERLQTHGQGTKVVSQMASACERVEDIPLILDMPAPVDAPASANYDKYEGATVKDPITGYYKTHPVTVVDFCSLYPSAMIAHNICKSTHVRRPADFDKPGVVPHRISEDTTHRFTTLNPGLLPTMLQELLALRKKIKTRMASVEATLEDDSAPHSDLESRDLKSLLVVLNKRQLAVKISANSIYGFMGAESTGPYPSREAAETTTAIGRTMLDESTKEAINFARTLLRRDGGRVGDLTVVYGDTDSLMFTMSNVFEPSDAADAGEAIAAHITTMYHARGETAKKLEFEKCYFPWMLFSKKKYGGMLWNRHSSGKVVCRGASHSGTPNKRRDSCLFVQKLYDGIVTPLLHERDDAKAMATFHAEMRRLVRGDVDFDDFVITKAVRDEYKTSGVLWACQGWAKPARATREVPIAHLLAPKLKAVLLMNGDERKARYELTRKQIATLKAAFEKDAAKVMADAAAKCGPCDEVVASAHWREQFKHLASPPHKLDIMTNDYCVVHGLFFTPIDEPLAHMRVVQKQRERDAGSEVRCGDRVPMIYVKGPAGSKARDIVEDVAFAKTHNRQLNIPYYLEHQVEAPITSLLSLIHDDPVKLFRAYANEYDHIQSSQRRLDAFCRSEPPATSRSVVESIVAELPVKKQKRSGSAPSSSILKWTKKS